MRASLQSGLVPGHTGLIMDRSSDMRTQAMGIGSAEEILQVQTPDLERQIILRHNGC